MFKLFMNKFDKTAEKNIENKSQYEIINIICKKCNYGYFRIHFQEFCFYIANNISFSYPPHKSKDGRYIIICDNCKNNFYFVKDEIHQLHRDFLNFIEISSRKGISPIFTVQRERITSISNEFDKLYFYFTDNSIPKYSIGILYNALSYSLLTKFKLFFKTKGEANV